MCHPVNSFPTIVLIQRQNDAASEQREDANDNHSGDGLQSPHITAAKHNQMVTAP